MKTEISSPITVCALSRTDVSNLLFVGNYAKDQQILLDDYFQFSLHLSTNFSCFYCWKPSNVIFKKIVTVFVCNLLTPVYRFLFDKVFILLKQLLNIDLRKRFNIDEFYTFQKVCGAVQDIHMRVYI